MKHTPKVSIVCRTYNHTHCIEEAVNSVLEQSFQDWELIIADDCSTDDTFEKISKYDDKRIKIFKNEKNLGIIGNLNKVLSHTTGEYISILDGDDVYAKTKLEKQVEFLDKNQEYGAVFSYLEFIGETGAKVSILDKLINNPSGTQEEMLAKFFFYTNFLAFPTEMFRKEFKFVYPENLIAMGDCNFHIHTLLKTKIKVLEEPLVKYRLIGQNKQTSDWMKNESIKIERMFVLDTFLKLENNIELFKKIFKGKYEKFGNPEKSNIPYLLTRIAMNTQKNSFWGYYTFSKITSDTTVLQDVLENNKLTYKDYIEIKKCKNCNILDNNLKKVKKILLKIIYILLFIIALLLFYIFK